MDVNKVKAPEHRYNRMCWASGVVGRTWRENKQSQEGMEEPRV